ncbi:sensor histidine kinase [Actinomadura harenae]|uniref:sensor histidine kinase n=1 Tax=Actinomadura harenae TaxID=2483351 RepID=UPI0013153C1B|nr:histidine kinase [Actinomadura harenae]
MIRSRDPLRPPWSPAALFLFSLGLWCGYRSWNVLVGSHFLRPAATGTGLLAAAGLVVLAGLPAAIAFGALPRRWIPVALAVQAALAFGPYPFVGAPWWSASALVVTSLLLTVGHRWAWLPVGLVVAAEFLARMAWGHDRSPAFAAYSAMVTLTVGTAFFAMARLTRYADELRATRAELAPLEVARERLRIARGLDAALGRRLALILTLARSSRPGAFGGAGRIVEVARDALEEVRAVSADQRERTLDDEVEAARAVLEAAGVVVAVDAPPLGLAAAEDAALAALLRRTVVAVLRQEPPERCSIELTAPAGLAVSFDGASADLADALQGPAARLGELGGRLGTTPSSVRASVPARRPRGARVSGMAPWLAWFVLLLFEIDHVGTTLLALYDGAPDPAGVGWAGYAVACTFLPLVGPLQLWHVYPRENGAPPRALWASLCLQILLLGTAFVVIGPKLTPSYMGLVAGVVLFHVRPPWSWGTAALLVGFPLLNGILRGTGWAWALSNLVPIVQFAILVYVLCRLPVAIAALAEARREVARMAVVRERLRIARDVHDLMGFQLSAIVLKAELAARLADRDPGAARARLDELAALAEEALVSVRSIARVRASLSLRAEVETARSMLEAAGIEVRVDTGEPPPGEAPPGVDVVEAPPCVDASAAAIVLREAATNIVRHGRDARECAIEISVGPDGLRLSVSNDGAVPPGRGGGAPGPGRGGSGLANLRARSAEAGGTLEVRREGDRFTLIAEFPAHPASALSAV